MQAEGPKTGNIRGLQCTGWAELRKTFITIAAAGHTMRIESPGQSLLSLRGSREIPSGKKGASTRSNLPVHANPNRYEETLMVNSVHFLAR